MGKLDNLARSVGKNAQDSAGAARVHQDAQIVDRTPDQWRGVERARDVMTIELDRIIADPDQPRTEFDEDELLRLAESLKTRGQLQPIRVRWSEGRGVYVVVVGERRWRAARMAGLASLTCVLHGGAEDELLEDQLVENALRQDLKPVEQGRAYQRLMASRGWSQRDLAERLSIAPSSVARAVKLLELPEVVQESVDAGIVPAATAYEIAQLPNVQDQVELAQAAVEAKLTRSEVAEAVRAVRSKRPAPAARPEPMTIDLGDLSITIRWKKAGSTPVQALRRGLKEAQAQERGEGEAA